MIDFVPMSAETLKQIEADPDWFSELLTFTLLENDLREPNVTICKFVALPGGHRYHVENHQLVAWKRAKTSLKPDTDCALVKVQFPNEILRAIKAFESRGLLTREGKGSRHFCKHAAVSMNPATEEYIIAIGLDGFNGSPTSKTPDIALPLVVVDAAEVPATVMAKPGVNKVRVVAKPKPRSRAINARVIKARKPKPGGKDV